MPCPGAAKSNIAKEEESNIADSNRTWNPGDLTSRNNLVNIKVPSHVYSLIVTVMVADVADVDVGRGDESMEEEELPRTELDSHANMPVVGRHAYIISDTGRIADVNAFAPAYDYMQVPIMDAAVQYDCPYDGISYILMIRNALHVLSMMKNNLLPPFVLREAGSRVK